MDNTILIIAGIAIGALIGFIIAKMLERSNASKLIKSAKKSAAAIVKEANEEGESMKEDKILQAKEKCLELKAEHEKVIMSRDKKMSDAETRIRAKESKVPRALSKPKKLNT